MEPRSSQTTGNEIDVPVPTQAMEDVGGPGGAPMKSLDKTKNWFNAVAVVLLKSVLLFFLLNLLLYPVSLVMRPRKPAGPLERYGEERVLRAYPGWREADIKTLLLETWRNPEQEYEPFTGFREIPFRGKFVNIDRAGFRFSKGQAPWPPRPEVTNVFVFGGSTTFGVGLPDDETIASYLQECAPANHPNSPLAVYNFGRPGYFSGQELILFQGLLKAGFVPQVAVFIDGFNDFFFPDGQPRYTGTLRRVMAGQVSSGPLNNMPVVWAVHWLRAHWRKAQPQEGPDYADPEVLQQIIHRWLANKVMIEAVAVAFGVRTVFVWQPVPMYKYDLRYDLFSHYVKEFGPNARAEYGYKLMENLRAQGKLGRDMLWLADMQQDKRENLYVDNFHYTAPFSEEIATRICRFLEEEHPED